ncbi:hypothetical protein GH722_17200 [Alphaproteobacteria bacterium HT1-32]|nr:hypothetical protein [Alphaproteobacteria bacterium HT1-32]|tara:strand:+ start:646 stop:1392 length:747 start_codon:yes stop_codon:yes gene_type:complete
MSKFLSIILLGVGVLASVSGCVTSGLDTPEARRASNIVGNKCVIVRSRDNAPSYRRFEEEIQVYSIQYAESGWVRFDVAANGIRGNIYYYPDREEVVCGSDNWRKREIPFRQISASEYQQKFKGYWGESGAETQTRTTGAVNDSTKPSDIDVRSIAVIWEGVSDLLAGTVEMRRSGRQGTLKVSIPDQSAECIGSYQMQSAGSGIWSVACDNGLTASGDIEALGAGKGAKGTGRDSNMRKLTFTVGAK